jgi:hypothetical protein
MLPISDVISCSDDESSNDRKWDKSSDNRSATFSAYHKYSDDRGMGWSVSANVSVSTNGDGYGTAYAGASPSMVDPEALRLLCENGYTENSKSYSGNATVKAVVYPYQFDAAERENYEDTPYPSTILIATAEKIVLKCKWVHLTGASSTTTHQVKLEVTAGGKVKGLVEVSGTAGYQYTDENNVVWEAVIGEDTTKDIYQEGKPTKKTASKTGGSDWFTALATVTSFGMQSCSFDGEQVSLSKNDCTLEELGY